MIPAQIHPLVLPLLFGGLVAAGTALYSFRRGTRVGRTFGALMAAVSWWAITYGMELTCVRLEAMLMWIKIEYPAIVATPIIFFRFCMEYSGRGDWLTPVRRRALFVIPAAVLALVWTLPLHRLYYADFFVAHGRTGLAVLGLDKGLGYWINIIYAYLLIATGLAVLGHMYVSSRRPYRSQIAIVFLGALVPFASNIVLNPLGMIDPPVDPTPAAFSFSGVIIAYSLFRFRFLDLLPSARAVLVDSIADSWVVVDETGRVVDLNTASLQQLAIAGEPPIGERLEDVIRTHAVPKALGDALLSRVMDGSESDGDDDSVDEITLGALRGGKYLELRATTLTDSRGRRTGRLLVLTDVTEGKRLALRQADLIEELQEALAQIRTLSGLLPICAHCHKIRDDTGYWHRVEEYIENRSEAQFTHGICPECLKELYPQLSKGDPEIEEEQSSVGDAD